MTIKKDQHNSSHEEHSDRYKRELGVGVKTTHWFRKTIQRTNGLCRSQQGLKCLECTRIQNVFKIVIYFAFPYSGKVFFFLRREMIIRYIYIYL